jgi:hypothetical protein
MGHATMENRHGLAVAGRVTHANGTAERRASETMLKARRKAVGHRITAGEDKAYDTADHVANLRAINVTPHVTQNQAITKTGKTRNSAIDERTTRHNGYPLQPRPPLHRRDRLPTAQAPPPAICLRCRRWLPPLVRTARKP